MCKKSFLGSVFCFHSHDSVVYRAKVLNFDEVKCVCVCVCVCGCVGVCIYIYVYIYMDCAFGVITKNSSHNSRSQRLSPLFLSRIFIVLGFIVSSVIHFEFIVTCGVKHITNF